jgi:AcrR family transcriptional regulator
MAKHSNLPRVRKTSTSTRDALIRAAEQLMAAHGIEGVELREINRLAGQRNSSAVHYHFTDREGLIAAIRDKHRPAITADRQRRLDELADGPDVSINDLVRALVEPMSAPLATASGRDFLIIAAESAGRIGSHALLTSDLPYNAGLARINQLLLDRIAGTADRR